MDHHTATKVASALQARLPASAPVLGIAGTATRVWMARYAGPTTEHAAMQAVVDATWSLGYPAGTARGRQLATAEIQRHVFDEMSLLLRANIADPNAQRLLWAVATASTSIAHATLIDSGPEQRDYLTAWGDHGDDSTAGRLAAAARVGWMHGHYKGRRDAAAKLTAQVVSEVNAQLGRAAIQDTWIAEMPGHDWLATVEFNARQAAELPREFGPQIRHSFQPLVVQPGQAQLDPTPPVVTESKTIGRAR